MEEQRERARSGRHATESMKVQGGPLSEFTDKSEFIGYTGLIAEARIIALVVSGELVQEAAAGVTAQVILDRTPFYAESGGQVSDFGILEGTGVVADVREVTKAPHGQHVHTVLVREGALKAGTTVSALVDRANRSHIIKNHTATHLLHKALKEVLGQHVNQAGSLVSADRLRFDFSHFGSISAEELQDIEIRVNRQIWEGTEVDISSMPIDDAKALGAMALFGEKYGDVVRVVRVGDYSIELCGGCHVSSTAQIGLFKIVSESGIGSGVRRIEAVTGKQAYEYLDSQLELLKEAAQLLKTNVADLPRRVEVTLSQMKELSRENESLRAKASLAEAGSLTDKLRTIGGIPVLAEQVHAGDMDSLRNMVDSLKAKLGSAVIVLGSVQEDKVNLVAAVTPDLVAKGLHAGKLVKEAAARCGGGGGGRPDMAQAGGKDPSKLAEALELAADLAGKQGAGV